MHVLQYFIAGIISLREKKNSPIFHHLLLLAKFLFCYIAVCVHSDSFQGTFCRREEVLLQSYHPSGHRDPTRLHECLCAIQVCRSTYIYMHVCHCVKIFLNVCRFLNGTNEAFSTEPLKNENQDLALGFYHMKNVCFI